ncbi:serine-rich adhesin for platelets-like [Palaemon carinicauda]|uniref:serine-rich adhesin for platelets-like n=1 Tax=Palaemon carinicauda TaxID=392227 RepID=UPI0035B60655
MEEMENLIEDMNPWELAKNMSLASSQSSSSGIKGSTILRKANNISSIFSKASRPFQKASLSDSNPLDPIQESGVHPESEEAASLSTTSTIKVKLEDLTTESFDGDSLTSGHGKGIANLWENKRSAMFSKASSSVPVLRKDQCKLGTVSDATISIDVLNCSPPMTLNSPSGDAKESNLSGDDAQKTFVPTVKKVPVFGGRKTQITKGALDKEDNSVPKKIPKFSSSVVKRAPPFVSNHSKSISQGNGGNKVSGSQLLKPSLQSQQSNRDVKDSQMETDSLRKPNKETSSEDKGKETMKVSLTEISSVTNESEAMQSNSSRLFFNTNKKENAKSHACESLENGHEEIPKSITPPKTNPKQNIKASAKTKDGKDKASRPKFPMKIDEKKSCSAPSIKKSETVRHVKLACDDKTSKSSSSASEQHLEKTSEICDGDKNKDVLALQDLENEESNVCVDSLLDEESSSMGEGHICKEAALEIPMNSKTPDSRSHLYCSKSQKQGLAMEIGNKNAEQVGSVSYNSDLKKEKKCISKTQFSPKKADKWDRIFRAVISQVMSVDVNSQIGPPALFTKKVACKQNFEKLFLTIYFHILVSEESTDQFSATSPSSPTLEPSSEGSPILRQRLSVSAIFPLIEVSGYQDNSNVSNSPGKMAIKSVNYAQLGNISAKMLKEVPPMFSPISVSTTTAVTTIVTTSTTTAPVKKIVGSTIVTPMGWNKRGRPSTKSRPLLHNLTTAKVTTDIQGTSLPSSLGNVISLGTTTNQISGRSGIVSVNSKGSTPITTSIILSSSASTDTHQMSNPRSSNNPSPRGGNAGVRVYSGSPKATPPSFLLTNVSSASSARMASPSMVITNTMNLSSATPVVSTSDTNTLALGMGSVVVSAGGVSSSGSVVSAGRGRVILTSSPRLIRPFVGQSSRTITTTRALNTRPTVMLVTTATPPSTTTTTCNPVSRRASTLSTALTPTSIALSTNQTSSLTVASSIPINSANKTAAVPTGELAILVAASEMSERADDSAPSSNELNICSLGSTVRAAKSPPALLITSQLTPAEEGSAVHDSSKIVVSQTYSTAITDMPNPIDPSVTTVTSTLEANPCPSVPQLQQINISTATSGTSIKPGSSWGMTTPVTKQGDTPITSILPVNSTILASTKRHNSSNLITNLSTVKQSGAISTTKQSGAITTIITTTNATQTTAPTTLASTVTHASHTVIASTSTTTTQASTSTNSALKTINTSSSKQSPMTTIGSKTIISSSKNENSMKSTSASSLSESTANDGEKGCILTTLSTVSNVKSSVASGLSVGRTVSGITDGTNMVISSISKCPATTTDSKTVITTTTSSASGTKLTSDTITKMTVTTSGNKNIVTCSASKTSLTTSTNKAVQASNSPKTTIITSSTKCPATCTKTVITTTSVKSSTSSESKNKSIDISKPSSSNTNTKNATAVSSGTTKVVPSTTDSNLKAGSSSTASDTKNPNSSSTKSSSATSKTNQGSPGVITRTYKVGLSTRSRRSAGSSLEDPDNSNRKSNKRELSPSSKSPNPKRGRPRGRGKKLR